MKLRHSVPLAAASMFMATGLGGSAAERTPASEIITDCADSIPLTLEELQDLPGSTFRDEVDALSDPVMRAGAVLFVREELDPRGVPYEDTVDRGGLVEVDGGRLAVVTTSSILEKYVQSSRAGLYITGLGWLQIAGCAAAEASIPMVQPEEIDQVEPTSHAVIVSLPNEAQVALQDRIKSGYLLPFNMYDPRESFEFNPGSFEEELVAILPDITNSSFLDTIAAEGTMLDPDTMSLQVTTLTGGGKMSGTMCPALEGAVVVRGTKVGEDYVGYVGAGPGSSSPYGGVYTLGIISEVWSHTSATRGNIVDPKKACGDLAKVIIFSNPKNLVLASN